MTDKHEPVTLAEVSDWKRLDYPNTPGDQSELEFCMRLAESYRQLAEANSRTVELLSATLRALRFPYKTGEKPSEFMFEFDQGGRFLIDEIEKHFNLLRAALPNDVGR